MRYFGILLVIVSLPAFIVWLKGDRRNYRYAYVTIGLLPFVMGALNLDASIYNYGGLGYVKGLVITILDTLCLAILANSRARLKGLPFTGFFIAYIFAALLSILPSEGFMPSFSYAFQVMRAMLVFVTVATVVQNKDALRYIAYGLALGAMIQGVTTVSQRLGGTFQAAGTMGHQNLTGMVLHFATLPLLAMLLAGDRSKIYVGGVAGGLTAVALGASRGSIAFLALGLGVLLMGSLMRSATPRKFGVLGLSVLMIAAASPVVISGLETRLAGSAQHASDYDERAAFEDAASMIFADHPMGIGANRYTLIANIGGYSERAGVTWATGSRNAVVHNLYYLTAAELGWVGLFTIIPLIIWVVLRGLHFAFRYRRDPRGDVVLGCTCAVLATALQSNYEWVFVISNTQYVFAISAGIIAGFIVQRKTDMVKARRALRSAGRGQPVQTPVAAHDSA